MYAIIMTCLWLKWNIRKCCNNHKLLNNVQWLNIDWFIDGWCWREGGRGGGLLGVNGRVKHIKQTKYSQHKSDCTVETVESFSSFPFISYLNANCTEFLFIFIISKEPIFLSLYKIEKRKSIYKVCQVFSVDNIKFFQFICFHWPNVNVNLDSKQILITLSE